MVELPYMSDATKKVTFSDWLQAGTLRLSRVHFFFVSAIIAQIILYDAGKILTPTLVMWRWIAAIILLLGTGTVWHLAHNQNKSVGFYKKLIYGLILLDIAVATFGVYTQRGMASRAVFLYAIPIAVSAILLSRVALFTTAIISIAAYTAAAVTYFVLNFNEGYKIELYGEIGFYSAMFLILAGMLSAVIHFRNSNN